MVGIPHCVDRQCDRCGDFVFNRSDNRTPVAATSSGKITEASRLATGSGTRRLEADFAQPTASIVSQQLNELPLRANQNSFSHLHALDHNWPSAGAISLCLSGDLGTIRTTAGPRRNSSASLRILGLGGWTAGLAGNSSVDGQDCCARFARKLQHK